MNQIPEDIKLRKQAVAHPVISVGRKGIGRETALLSLVIRHMKRDRYSLPLQLDNVTSVGRKDIGQETALLSLVFPRMKRERQSLPLQLENVTNAGRKGTGRETALLNLVI